MSLALTVKTQNFWVGFCVWLWLFLPLSVAVQPTLLIPVALTLTGLLMVNQMFWKLVPPKEALNGWEMLSGFFITALTTFITASLLY